MGVSNGVTTGSTAVAATPCSSHDTFTTLSLNVKWSELSDETIAVGAYMHASLDIQSTYVHAEQVPPLVRTSSKLSGHSLAYLQPSQQLGSCLTTILSPFHIRFCAANPDQPGQPTVVYNHGLNKLVVTFRAPATARSYTYRVSHWQHSETFAGYALRMACMETASTGTQTNGFAFLANALDNPKCLVFPPCTAASGPGHNTLQLSSGNRLGHHRCQQAQRGRYIRGFYQPV